MGAAGSRIEEDKAVQLCRERKKFIKQALHFRWLLATTHVTYIQSLRSTGSALRKFVEPEAPVESSLYTSTNATPEPPALTEKSLSQQSFSSPSSSQQVHITETFSPSPSPPSSSHFQANHMKFFGFSSKKIEERPSEPVIATVTASNPPQNTARHSTEKPESSPTEGSSVRPGTPLWDYFALSHPIDHQFSFQEGKELNQGLENAYSTRQLREQEGMPELEEEDKVSFCEREESYDSDDEFDEPSADTLVRSFENLNRVHEHNAASASPILHSGGSVASETEFMNGERNSPDLSPLKATSSTVNGPTDANKKPLKEDSAGSEVAPKDFLSSMKEIESLFTKASDSGKEIPRMLEANKLHFRPIFPGKESVSKVSIFLRACFSCGEYPSQVKEEPPQTSVKYLTWHRTTSSSSAGNSMGLNVKDDVEGLTNNLFNDICMISSGHASTLDRLYAWERKLYDEVKISEAIRRAYELKRKVLRQLESKGESHHKIDKTRALIKDLHSRIRVAIHRIDSISKRIEDLHDKELQPQLEELIKGLRRMWEVMHECHNHQFQVISAISAAYNDGSLKISVQSESHRLITAHLENELSSLASSFTKWIDAQKSYFQAIDGWLVKCVFIQKPPKRKRKHPPKPFRASGPPIYVMVGGWLEKTETLPKREVSDSIKGLAAEVSHFLPRQEKNQGKRTSHSFSTLWKGDTNSDSGVNLLRDDVSEEWVSGFDRFHNSLVEFLSQLNKFAEASVKMYAEVDKETQDVKQDVKNEHNKKSAHDPKSSTNV
ncbi:hypothetical protein SLA2020_172140 [Shorea laevis]